MMSLNNRWSRRHFLQLSAAVGAGAALAEYGLSGDPAFAAAAALIEAARKEGALSTIALPRDWANYGEIIDAFSKKYPDVKYTGLNPDAASAEELQAIEANKTNKGPQAPDVIDVGFSFGPEAKSKKLTMPFKVSTWNSIPDGIKDPEGHWVAGYYGVMAIQVNKAVVKTVPQDFADLLKPEYKGQVSLAGDPRSSSQAISAVTAVSIASGGKMGDGQPGLEFFKKLNAAGNFVPVIGKQGTFAKGETPIILRWDYNALADRDALKGNPDVEVVIPKSVAYAGVYVQAISAFSPRPNAAKLWQEFLFSDEGQMLWLKGYATPSRFDDLKKRKVIPADLMAKLPKIEGKTVFATVDELAAFKKSITENWDKVVAADVK